MSAEKPLKEKEPEEFILEEANAEREKQLNALLASGKTEEFLRVSELEESKKDKALERLIERKKALLDIEKLEKEIQRETWDWRFRKGVGVFLMAFGLYVFLAIDLYAGLTLVTLGAGAFNIFNNNTKKSGEKQ